MSAQRKEVNAQFPQKLEFLFRPARYKVAYGGRGSAKSWSFARALLIEAAAKPLRILCTREVQDSIKDSVHRLLSDQVEQLGLGHCFDVLTTEIRGKNGSMFVFSGLATQTVESIKSFEGVDRVWVEEAQKVSKRSWDVLTPTIRKPNSEIWISYNPELESDETHQRFTVNPQPDSIVVHVNWNDNPWFPKVLEAERRECQKRDPESYPNIWGGQCKPAVEGAIYYRQVAELENQGRIRQVPYDPMLKVHTVWDLGWNDQMTIILAQRVASEVRIIDYIEDSHRTLTDYAADLNARNLNWGDDWLPHDGYTKDFKTGKSAQEILKASRRKVRPRENSVPNMSVESGIEAGRMLFQRAYFNRDTTGRLVECLKRYRRQVNKATNEPGQPLHDVHSHGADVWRYLALVADKFSNDANADKPLVYDNRGIV